MPLSCKTLVNQFGNKEEIGIHWKRVNSTILKFKAVFIISLIITRRYKKKTIIGTEVWLRLFFITFYLLFDGLSDDTKIKRTAVEQTTYLIHYFH